VDDPAAVEARAVAIASDVGGEHRATPLHLAMLRLPAAEVERALERERAAASEAWARGWPQEGIRRFFAER
jgi:hypothetical protein